MALAAGRGSRVREVECMVYISCRVLEKYIQAKCLYLDYCLVVSMILLSSFTLPIELLLL